jgi:hypothetical protein
MAIVPDHGSELVDPAGEGSFKATAAPYPQPVAGRVDAGEDVYVGGRPMVLETDGPQEVTRRVLAGLVIAGYSILTAMGLAATAFAKSDVQAVALILTPYGTLVTAVIAYYFLKARR